MVLWGTHARFMPNSLQEITDVLRDFTARRSTMRPQRRIYPALHLMKMFSNVYSMFWTGSDVTTTNLLGVGIGNRAAFVEFVPVRDKERPLHSALAVLSFIA
jgi:hypothetical protein